MLYDISIFSLDNIMIIYGAELKNIEKSSDKTRTCVPVKQITFY